MKRFFVLLSCLIFIPNNSFSQYKLEIEINGIRNNNGNIMMQFFDANEQVLTQDTGQIKENNCFFTISDLKPGKYAVRYYHDENLNGIMEKNAVGKPLEGYGFSNNVIGKFGPPPFEKWLFALDGDKKIFLKPTY
jgi:uncharacterized protein (DUF2141 family)